MPCQGKVCKQRSKAEAHVKFTQMFCRFSARLGKHWFLSAKMQLLLTRAVLPEVYCSHMILHLLQPLWWVKGFQSVDSDDVVQLIMKDGLDALIVESSG